MKEIVAWFKDLWEGIRIVLIFLMFFWFIGLLARLAWGVVMIGWGMI
jgi:hypothetical protein